ncbi:hypothetical protein GBAR_LOCUS11260 [Geodia barretti]|uniref:Uncharacterized protein n=1 Tax=Geodia barretti TaxID=519541 RepID=A0AA35WLB8_GEOBA|nr:hypothetical protein GBAR_LOCUS11260 [Geodia barretti]
MAEVKSADQETALRPELSLGYRHRYNGPRDYGKVIELLRGNLVEPVTPTSQHATPLIQDLDIPSTTGKERSEVRDKERELKQTTWRTREIIEKRKPRPSDNQTDTNNN